MRRLNLCPQCGGPCSSEEIQGLCPRCLRRMLARRTEPIPSMKSKPDRKTPPPAVTAKTKIIQMRSLPLFLVLMLLVAPSLRAQVVADGATNTLGNVTNTFTGDVTVGTNGSFT